jgi:hypothetical protein
MLLLTTTATRAATFVPDAKIGWFGGVAGTALPFWG